MGTRPHYVRRAGRRDTGRRSMGLTQQSESRPKCVLRIVLIAAAAVFLGAAPGAHATPTNLVPNPGFEQAGCGNTPTFCGWLSSGWMAPETTNPHSGAVSMFLQTCVGACNADDSWTFETAYADPAFCATIGPGTHPASFWYAGGSELARLSATFYARPDCTGGGTS